MRTIMLAAAAATILATGTPSPVSARSSGGGDREPAGGAFMTSYPEQGSTGLQRGGPPRSVDIPRDAYGRPLGRMPWGYYPGR